MGRCTEAGKRELGVKFDIVIGNPPYQNGGAAGNFALWPLFITKAAASLKDGGHLSFIVPQTWASNAIIAKKNAKDVSVVRSTVLSTGRLIDVDFTVGKYFNVGSTFSAFTWQKNRAGLTRITTECGDHSVDYTTLPWLPIFGGELTLSILTKTVWGEHPKEALINDGKEICGFRNGSAKVADSKSSKFSNLIANTSAQYSKGIYLYSAEKQSCHGVAKIIFSDSGYAKPFYDKTGEYGLGHHARGIIAKTQKKANAIICMMESKLTRFIAQTKCETGTASAIARIQDCLLSLDAPMTDAEIYKKFNLSAAEIKLIESTVQ